MKFGRKFIDQIYWYCGSSRERTSWGKKANRLVVYFSRLGTIHFWSHKCGTVCTFVGNTKDYCRSAQFIRVPNKNGYLAKRIYKKWNGNPGQVVKLPGLYRQVFWYCGNSRERSAFGRSFNQLSIKYFTDGRIEWNAYKCG